MHSHLVTVEVGVEGRTDEWVQLDGRTLDEVGFECLDRQTVQRRSTIQEHQVFLDDFFEHVPHLGFDPFDQLLGGFDIADNAVGYQALHHKRLEQLECHLLGQTTLMELEVWTDHDDRTARVVDTLTEQVLTEPTLLALEHVAQ